jgi:hypothetical protein
MGIETKDVNRVGNHFAPRNAGLCVAVVGSRDFADLDRVRRFVRQLPVGVTVLSGGARGVDRCAAAAARARGLRTLEFFADWERDGRYLAGRRRNQHVAEHCDRMLAFWDGRSSGTQDAFSRALRLGRSVVVYRLRVTALVGTLTMRPVLQPSDHPAPPDFDLTVVRSGSTGREISKVYALEAPSETAAALATLRGGTELRVRAAIRHVFVSGADGRLERRSTKAEVLSFKRTGGKRRNR